jgi:ubiquinone/menaquinone biosynthesis C-methylase UbiE
MGRHVRLRELLIGVEGLALLRHLYDGSDDDADRRLDEVRRVLDDGALDGGELTTESDARTGYRAWSENYDEPGNPLIALEEPAVWSLVDGLGRAAPGAEALDAACGTGRHARHLVQQGYGVVGTDLTPEMLDKARANVPEAEFLEADLRDLPLESERFDLVTCGLAVAHLPELGTSVAEVARVLRPGGHAVLSALHPFQAHLGWHAPFEDADGNRGFVREHSHTHADYFAAFRAAGFEVRDCVEPELSADQARTKRRAFRHIPDATLAAYVGLPAALVWLVRKA